MIEIACLIVVGVVTWMVASEGIWGAAQVFLCTLISGLLAMNFFEPLANQLNAFLPDNYCDIVALLGLFIVFVCALRMGGEQIAPSYIQVVPAIDTVGRWLFGAVTGYLTMAILLTSLHTAPLPREFMGFTPERSNFFGAAPDRQWLGFVQYISERPLGTVKPHISGTKRIYVANAFDGHYEKVGDPEKPYAVRDLSGRETPQVIWPSFPIRYASRRDRIALNLSNAPPLPTTMTPTAPVNSAPAGGQGSANPGF